MQVTELVGSNEQRTIGYSVHFYPGEPWKLCGGHLDHIKELHSDKVTVTRTKSVTLCQIPNCNEKMTAEVEAKFFFTAVMLKNEI